MSTGIIPSLGICASLHALIQGSETLLSQAEVSCTTLRTAHTESDHISTSLVQLDQALLDARDYIQREYDHISNTYGNAVASKGDQTACLQFWMICGKIEEHITKPLEKLVQHFLHHQAHHNGHSHIHHHCYFCTSYYYHHHSRRVHFLTGGLLIGGSEVAHHGHHGHHDHHDSHHQHLTEYETRFQEMTLEWSGIKTAVASCFDDLETRLKDKNTPKDKGPDKTKVNGEENKGKYVADAAHKMIEATNMVDEEMRLISNVEDKIFAMGARLLRGRSRATSSSRSSSTSISTRF